MSHPRFQLTVTRHTVPVSIEVWMTVTDDGSDEALSREAVEALLADDPVRWVPCMKHQYNLMTLTYPSLLAATNYYR